MDVKRERVIQLKALNMTCAEQIAMLKRSVEKGVIVGPRQYVTHSIIAHITITRLFVEF